MFILFRKVQEEGPGLLSKGDIQEYMVDANDNKPTSQPRRSLKKAARDHKKDTKEKDKINRDKSVYTEDVKRAASRNACTTQKQLLV